MITDYLKPPQTLAQLLEELQDHIPYDSHPTNMQRAEERYRRLRDDEGPADRRSK